MSWQNLGVKLFIVVHAWAQGLSYFANFTPSDFAREAMPKKVLSPRSVRGARFHALGISQKLIKR